MKNNKLAYEEVSLEIVFLNESDVITTSGFHSPEHSFFEWLDI